MDNNIYPSVGWRFKDKEVHAQEQSSGKPSSYHPSYQYLIILSLYYYLILSYKYLIILSYLIFLLLSYHISSPHTKTWTVIIFNTWSPLSQIYNDIYLHETVTIYNERFEVVTLNMRRCQIEVQVESERRPKSKVSFRG